jgi:hypothetical protein
MLALAYCSVHNFPQRPTLGTIPLENRLLFIYRSARARTHAVAAAATQFRLSKSRTQHLTDFGYILNAKCIPNVGRKRPQGMARGVWEDNNAANMSAE